MYLADELWSRHCFWTQVVKSFGLAEYAALEDTELRWRPGATPFSYSWMGFVSVAAGYALEAWALPLVVSPYRRRRRRPFHLR